MLLPLGVALATVSAGTWLAVAPREGTRSLRVIRWLALLSAVGVIALHLVPEAFEGLGLWALLGFVAGLGVPSLLEIGTRALLGQGGASSGHGHGHGHGHEPGRGDRDPGTFVSLELAYLGLLAHRFGDGLSLGAAEAAGTSLWGRVGVLLAVAAHIVPVTAVMILAIADARGRAAAVLHGAGLAVATMAGVIAAGAALGADALASGHAHGHGHAHAGHGPHAHLAGAWISAVVAGLLLHIVLHDMPRPFSSGDAPGRG